MGGHGAKDSAIARINQHIASVRILETLIEGAVSFLGDLVQINRLFAITR